MRQSAGAAELEKLSGALPRPAPRPRGLHGLGSCEPAPDGRWQPSTAGGSDNTPLFNPKELGFEIVLVGTGERGEGKHKAATLPEGNIFPNILGLSSI